MQKTEEGRKILSNVEERLKPRKDEVKRNMDSDGESISDSEEEPANVVAWISNITNDTRFAEQVRNILTRLDRTIKIDEGERIMNKCTIGNDVSEIYSPPRIAARVARHGLRSGFSLDFTEGTPDGEPWDFNKLDMRARVVAELEKDQPEMLILSPMCGPFGQLQGLKYSKLSLDEVESKLREGMTHLKFAIMMCEKQTAKGRYFMFEHPAGARSRAIETVKKVVRLPNVVTVDFDFCKFNMKSTDPSGEGLVKKRIRIMTNSSKLAKRLFSAQCSGDHRHVTLTNYRAGSCQKYTDEFCHEVCMAVRDEFMNKNDKEECEFIANVLNNISNVEVKHPHTDDISEFQEFYKGLEFYDDVYGRPFDKDRAIKARKFEMEFFKNMNVYSKVDRSVAKRLGAKIITTKWIDTNKGDDANPDYRARLVGREIKTSQRLDLFAATPLLESLRMVISICASNQHGQEPCRILSSDMKRAYFFAKAKRPIFIELPIEDREPGDEDKIGRLNLSLDGTRDAAMNWQDEFTTTLVKHGFEKGKASPCNFHHYERKLYVTVHGDDFTSTGTKSQLKWFQGILNTVYECKHHWFGPDSSEEDSVRILNRAICWARDCITYEADSRHAEVAIEQLKFSEAKSVTTPGIREEQKKAREEESELMSLEEASKYRMVVARLNYLSLDRFDTQYACKEASKYMASPQMHHIALLKRIGRYLMHAPRVIHKFKWQKGWGMATGHSDSDWAGDLKTRKSTSGGTCAIGLHTIKTRSSTQQVIALSSAEVELYAPLKCSCQTLGVLNLALDFGTEFKVVVNIDACAALAITQRQGLGKLRHIAAHWLWIQDKIKKGEISTFKVVGKSNPVDLMTKHLPAEEITAHLERFNFEAVGGNANKSLTMNQLSRKDHDYWVKDKYHNVMIHNKFRRQLFHPFQGKGPQILLTSHQRASPKACSLTMALHSSNKTIGRLKVPVVLTFGKPWTGKTIFIMKVDEVHDGSVSLAETRSHLLTRKQCELFQRYLVGISCGDETRAQVLTREWREILKQHPLRVESYGCARKSEASDNVVGPSPGTNSSDKVLRSSGKNNVTSSRSLCSVTQGKSNARRCDSHIDQTLKTIAHSDGQHSAGSYDNPQCISLDLAWALRGRCACACAGTSPTPGRYRFLSVSRVQPTKAKLADTNSKDTTKGCARRLSNPASPSPSGLGWPAERSRAILDGTRADVNKQDASKLDVKFPTVMHNEPTGVEEAASSTNSTTHSQTKCRQGVERCPAGITTHICECGVVKRIQHEPLGGSQSSCCGSCNHISHERGFTLAGLLTNYRTCPNANCDASVCINEVSDCNNKIGMPEAIPSCTVVPSGFAVRLSDSNGSNIAAEQSHLDETGWHMLSNWKWS